MPKKLADYEFEVWEIDFPNDPDGEPTRGISRKEARAMLRRDLIAVKYEGIVRNTYDQAVYTHTYTPTEGNEGVVFEAMLAEVYA